jgi:hypothetical protein
VPQTVELSPAGARSFVNTPLTPEPVFVNVYGAQQSIPRNLFRQTGNRFLGSLKGLQIRALECLLFLTDHCGKRIDQTPLTLVKRACRGLQRDVVYLN